jgi:hypothetical protein
MSVSVMGLPRLALIVLSGMLFLSLYGLHARASGQVREVVGPAATVVATAHYQAEITLSCSSDTCSGGFPKPGNKRRLNITRISCSVLGASGTTFALGRIELISANLVHVLYQWLPVDYSSPNGRHMLNRAVDMQVGSQQIAALLFILSGTAANGTCTASGTLDTLQ